MQNEEQNLNEAQTGNSVKADVMRSAMMKYIHITREEEIQFMSECINGKPHYTDSQIAMRMALLATKLK